jgi:hypothetical protein
VFDISVPFVRLRPTFLGWGAFESPQANHFLLIAALI